MRRQNLLILFAFFTLFSCTKQKGNEKEDLVQYVNPMVGSDSQFNLSRGNTYPAVALPWAMNFWTPQTAENGNGWAYWFRAQKINAIKQTHQPSPWINDYGCYSFMPMTNELKIKEDERASYFIHDKEKSTPYYYQVYLQSYDINFEIAPTDRAAMFRITYPKNEKAYLLIDAYKGGSALKYNKTTKQLSGIARNNHGGVEGDFGSRFVVEFNQEVKSIGFVKDGKKVQASEVKGEHCLAYIEFDMPNGGELLVKTASSFISSEQAQLNLSREIKGFDFNQVKDAAKLAWNKELDRVRVEGGTKRNKINFYTALYRTMLFPRKLYEYNKENEIVHYSPYNGKIEKGYMFTDNGFWDTFRAVFPYFSIMYPEMHSQIIQGMVNAYKEGGRFPEWASPGYRDCMIGSNSASLVAEAYVKGNRNFDAQTAFEAMIKNATVPEPRMNSLGRSGVNEYNKLGFVPCDINLNESAARSLEYAYNDFCIAQMAKLMGKKEEEKTYMAKAMNYKNLFDPEHKMMRGKKSDGTWMKDFDPFAWGGVFTEGSSWHYTWSVFQDPIGLANLMGGRKDFAQKLDDVFTTPAKSNFDYYGFKIHEILEMELLNMGQYAHGNQPIQHMIYLYNWAKEPWKAQYRARDVMEKLYGPGPDGLCGDEDNGQTSAWYVFSALGMYPVCPTVPEYALGSPLFEKVTLKLENGKEFVIEAKNNNTENVYIQSASFNGKEYTKTFLTHDDIMKGGSIKYVMDSKPNKERGTKNEDLGFSITKEMKN